MKLRLLLFASCMAIVAALSIGCSPKIYTSIQQSLPAREASAPVAIYGIQELSPDSALLVGSLQIKDTGFSTRCNYNQVIHLAMTETNRLGGNGFQITYHREPNALGSSCHRINGNVLQIPEPNLREHRTVTPASPVRKNNLLSDNPEKKAHATIFLNAGYAFVISKMVLDNGVTGDPKMGVDINGGFSVTSRSGFGGGLRFSHYNTNLQREGDPIKVRLNYVAPEFVMQHAVTRKLVLRETIGFGYANYTEKEGDLKGSISGVGTHLTFAVEYKIAPEIGIGAEAGMYFTRFGSTNNFTQIDEQAKGSGITRISLNGGLRFYF